jgi:ParB family chromosome partitioning protein
MASKKNGLGGNAATTLQRPTGRSLSQAKGTSTGVITPIAPPAATDRPTAGIISAMQQSGAGSVPVVPVDSVVPNPDNPRATLGDLSELAKSIEEKGILQPLVVTTTAAFLTKQPHHRDAIGEASYVIIAGHRRHGGAKLAGQTTVPIIVRDDLAGSANVAQTALIENIHRRNLAPLEEARGFQLLAELGNSQREISKSTGISQAQISKRLALLKLPQVIQDALVDDQLSVREALILAQLPNEEIVPAFVSMRENAWNAEQAVMEMTAARTTAEAIASARREAEAENLTLIDPREAFGAAELDHRLYEPADIERARQAGSLVGEATSDGLKYFTMTPAKKATPARTPADGDTKAHREALKARTEAGGQAVKSLPSAEEVRTAIAEAYLAGKTPHAECLKLTHRWLGDKLGAKTEDPHVWHQSLTSKDHVVHAAWAMTIAERELNTRWARGPWPADAVAYVTYLQHKVGYRPTPWELMKIESATAQPDSSPAAQESRE